MIAHFKKLGLFANTDVDLSVFSGINSGVEGASDVMITSEVFAPLQIEANQTVINGYDFTIDLRTLRNAGVTESQLYDFAQAQSTESLQLAILGISACLVSNGNWRLLFNDKISTNTYNDFKLTKRVTGLGYTSAGIKESGLHLGANLLGLYEVNAGDGTDLFGFLTSDDIQRSETAGAVTTLEDGTGVGIYRTQRIFFPFAGETVTASINLIQSSSASNTIGIVFLDDAAVAIGGSGVTTAMTTVAGRKSTSAVAPTGTAYVLMFVGLAINQQVEFSQPALRIDNSTEFTMF